MSLIPDEELRHEKSINLAPMVDFLFLVIAILATLAIARAALYDTEVNLVKVLPEKGSAPLTGYQDSYLINLSVTASGHYKWITEIDEYLMQDVTAIQKELRKQHEIGLLPKDKQKIKVLLHIDKNASWDPIAQLIFAVRESGFHIYPVYEPIDRNEASAVHFGA
jgi:biopolymer transport protein ExbD